MREVILAVAAKILCCSVASDRISMLKATQSSLRVSRTIFAAGTDPGGC